MARRTGGFAGTCSSVTPSGGQAAPRRGERSCPGPARDQRADGPADAGAGRRGREDLRLDVGARWTTVPRRPAPGPSRTARSWALARRRARRATRRSTRGPEQLVVDGGAGRSSRSVRRLGARLPAALTTRTSPSTSSRASRLNVEPNARRPAPQQFQREVITLRRRGTPGRVG